MKVIIEYDVATGEIKDSTGCIVGSMLGLMHFGEAGESSGADIAQLMALGTTADDLLKLKAAGVI